MGNSVTSGRPADAGELAAGTPPRARAGPGHPVTPPFAKPKGAALARSKPLPPKQICSVALPDVPEPLVSGNPEPA